MAIEFRPPRSDEQPQLHALFVEAFGEPEFADRFFRTAFSPDRCLAAVEEEVLGMLHWFDCTLDGKSVAYLYAIAVREDCRGRGIGSALIRFSTSYLQSYSGLLLVPATKALFSYYEALGFAPCGAIREYRAESGAPIPLRRLSPTEFAALRRGLLPARGVRQEGPLLELLSGYAEFYAGPNSLAVVSGGQVLEFLGDEGELPGLLAALGLGAAEVRMPGHSRPFAMGLGLRENLYFGLALD